jgi:hypothetical protein
MFSARVHPRIGLLAAQLREIPNGRLHRRPKLFLIRIEF